jgi:hypothetical protein
MMRMRSCESRVKLLHDIKTRGTHFHLQNPKASLSVADIIMPSAVFEEVSVTLSATASSLLTWFTVPRYFPIRNA